MLIKAQTLEHGPVLDGERDGVSGAGVRGRDHGVLLSPLPCVPSSVHVYVRVDPDSSCVRLIWSREPDCRDVLEYDGVGEVRVVVNPLQHDVSLSIRNHTHVVKLGSDVHAKG